MPKPAVPFDKSTVIHNWCKLPVRFSWILKTFSVSFTNLGFVLLNPAWVVADLCSHLLPYPLL